MRRRRAPDVLPLVAPVEAAIGREFDRLIAIVFREINELLIARGVRRDAVSTRELFRTLENRGNPKAILERLFEQVSREEGEALRKQLPTIPLPSVVSNGARLQEAWVSRNVDLIKAAEPIKRAIEKTLAQPLNEGVSVSEIRKELQRELGISKRRAQLIARDQTLKLAGQLAEARQKQAGIRRYVWTTSADERVRPDHAELDGQTFEWANPPVVDKRTGRRGHPGDDFQCRCTADPVLDDPEPEESAEPSETQPSPEFELPDPEPAFAFELPRPEPLPSLPPAVAPAAPVELLQRAELAVARGARGPARAEAQAAIANALPRKGLEQLRAIPFNATELVEDPTLNWLRASAFFKETGDVPDNFGSSKGGLPQFTIEPDGTVYLSNGRHRLTVARELGLRQIKARVRRVGARGGLLWEYVGYIFI